MLQLEIENYNSLIFQFFRLRLLVNPVFRFETLILEILGLNFPWETLFWRDQPWDRQNLYANNIGNWFGRVCERTSAVLGGIPESSFRVIVLAITFKYRSRPTNFCRSCLHECCARTEDGSWPTYLNYNGKFRTPNSRQFRFWAVRLFPFTKLFKTQKAQRCMQTLIGKNVTLHSFDFICSVCFPVSQYDQ